jgi:ATP-dependent Clp protease ATP-binding subunit ClpC
VFERFTELARQVLVAAQDEAGVLKHDRVGTEHILLGLRRVEDGLAAQVLASFDVTLDAMRAEVARVDGRGDAEMTGRIPFTPRAKKALELGLREALELGHDYLGTEHLLLGLTQVEDGVAARIFLGLEVGRERVRHELIRTLSAEVPPAELAREYAVKTLEGPSDTWAAQLAEGHGDGWELLSVVHEGGAVRAILERRRRNASA